MSIDELFKSIAAVVPSLVVGFVTAWADLFKATLLMRPDAGDAVAVTGVAFGCLASVFCALMCHDWPRPRLKRAAGKWLAACLILAVLCFAARALLAFPHTSLFQEITDFIWDMAVWLFIVAMVVTIVLATLSYIKGGPASAKPDPSA